MRLVSTSVLYWLWRVLRVRSPTLEHARQAAAMAARAGLRCMLHQGLDRAESIVNVRSGVLCRLRAARLPVVGQAHDLAGRLGVACLQGASTARHQLPWEHLAGAGGTARPCRAEAGVNMAGTAPNASCCSGTSFFPSLSRCSAPVCGAQKKGNLKKGADPMQKEKSKQSRTARATGSAMLVALPVWLPSYR